MSNCSPLIFGERIQLNKEFNIFLWLKKKKIKTLAFSGLLVDKMENAFFSLASDFIVHILAI